MYCICDETYDGRDCYGTKYGKYSDADARKLASALIASGYTFLADGDDPIAGSYSIRIPEEQMYDHHGDWEITYGITKAKKQRPMDDIIYRIPTVQDDDAEEKSAKGGEKHEKPEEGWDEEDINFESDFVLDDDDWDGE